MDDTYGELVEIAYDGEDFDWNTIIMHEFQRLKWEMERAAVAKFFAEMRKEEKYGITKVDNNGTTTRI